MHHQRFDLLSNPAWVELVVQVQVHRVEIATDPSTYRIAASVEFEMKLPLEAHNSLKNSLGCNLLTHLLDFGTTSCVRTCDHYFQTDLRNLDF